MRGDLLLLLADGVAILCLARFFLQNSKLEQHHPLNTFILKTTDWLIKPLQKPITRKYGRVAPVLAGFLLYYAVFTLMVFTAAPTSIGFKAIAANLLFTFVSLIKAAAYVLLIGLAVRAAVSFRNPYSPLNAALSEIYSPVLAKLNFIRIGRIDFSGSLLALVLWLLVSRMIPKIMQQINLWQLQ